MALQFGILVYDDVEPIDIGATYGVLSIARRIIPEIGMFLVSRDAGVVKLTGGLAISAHHGFADCPVPDALIVAGGPGWQTQCKSPETLRFLQRLAPATLIVSVCTGAMILAAAGLLDGHRATTRRLGVAGEKVPLHLMSKHYPGVEPLEAIIVDSGTVVTGGGVALGIDTTLYLLERFFGRARTAEVARLLEYTTARAANARSLETFIAPAAPRLSPRRSAKHARNIN